MCDGQSAEFLNLPVNCWHYASSFSPFLEECFRQSPFNSRSKSSSPAEASSSTRAAFHGKTQVKIWCLVKKKTKQRCAVSSWLAVEKCTLSCVLCHLSCCLVCWSISCSTEDYSNNQPFLWYFGSRNLTLSGFLFFLCKYSVFFFVI